MTESTTPPPDTQRQQALAELHAALWPEAGR